MGETVNTQRQINSGMQQGSAFGGTPGSGLQGGGFGGVSTQQQIQQRQATQPKPTPVNTAVNVTPNQDLQQQMTNNNGGQNCCFIMLEGHNGTLPWYVRLCRDHYYEQEPRVAEGYKRMAKWLVPLMRKSACIKHVVNVLMVKPITRYGAYLCNEANYSLRGHVAKLAWFAVWRLTAR